METKLLRHIQLFEKLLIKKTKLLFTSLTFLLRCRGQNTIPCFLQFRHHIYSRAANRICQSFIPIRLWRWNRQSVPKRRYIKFRRREITQKKAYNIQNTAEVWNQEKLINILLTHWIDNFFASSNVLPKERVVGTVERWFIWLSEQRTLTCQIYTSFGFVT